MVEKIIMSWPVLAIPLMIIAFMWLHGKQRERVAQIRKRLKGPQ